MNLTRVGVLRGGPSNEHDVSLQSGATVLRNLSPEKYHAIDIFIDRDGQWHIGGLAMSPHDVLSKVDVVFNALHGAYGEDGKVQRILDMHGIPYTGSDSISSAIGMNKALSKKAFQKAEIEGKIGLKIAQHVLIDKSEIEAETGGDDDTALASVLREKLLAIFRSFPMPVVVKPVASGSSVGVSIARSFEELEAGVVAAFEFGDVVMIEEFIQGTEATCGVIEGLRGQDLYALPPVEIRPTHGGFFDFEAKYEGKSHEIVPGNFTHAEKVELERLARAAHTALGLRHYSRTDFIISPRRGIYILETNTLPGLTEASLVPKALHAVGVSIRDFLDHLITLAIARK
ncbi:MAG: hypothetical protein RIT04_15 [Candidatus Parcubacteria bacterium]